MRKIVWVGIIFLLGISLLLYAEFKQPQYSVIFVDRQINTSYAIYNLAEGNYSIIIDSSGYLGSKVDTRVAITLSSCIFTGWWSSTQPVCGEVFKLVQEEVPSLNQVAFNITQYPQNPGKIACSIDIFCEVTGWSVSEYAAEFRLEASSPISSAVVKASDYTGYMQGYAEWQTSDNWEYDQYHRFRFMVILLTVIAILLSILFLGLSSIKKRLYPPQRRRVTITPRYSTRAPSPSKSSPTHNSATISSKLRQSYSICCRQTARLQERYCPCGHSIPDELFDLYQ